MFNNLGTCEDSFFSKRIRMRKRFSNDEIKLFQYFYDKTKVFPDNIIILNRFIFFFVNARDYFSTLEYIPDLRRDLPKYKALIIRSERRLLELCLGFFPDIYIHDIKITVKDKANKILFSLFMLNFNDRGIAIGREGHYIKTVNEVFEKYIEIEDFSCSIEIEIVLSYI